MTDDTVRRLLLDQLDRISSGSEHVSDVPLKLGSSAKPVRATILESVVGDTKRKKNTRRPVATSVFPIEKARDEIIARASAILRVDKSNQELCPLAKPGPVTSSSLFLSHQTSHDQNLPAPQPPRSSKMADVNTLYTPEYAQHSDCDAEDLPLATQVYAPSRLGQARTLHTSSILAPSSSVRCVLYATRSLMDLSLVAIRAPQLS